MDNEINLFDMLLAKKLGGGGGKSKYLFITENGQYLPEEQGADTFSYVDVYVQVKRVEVSATSFSTLTIPAPPALGVQDVGLLSFSLMGQTAVIAVYRLPTGSGDNKNRLFGGTIDNNGTVGAVFCASYTSGVQGVTVEQAGQITNGSYADITAYMGTATNIKLWWYGPDTLS